MENRNEFRDNQYAGNTPVALPNSTAVLVLGIISIVFGMCYGVIGLICAIISLVLYSKDKKLYIQSPQSYTPSSYSNLKAGRICAIIGLITSAIWFVIFAAIIAFSGMAFLTDPEHIFNQIR